MVEEPDFHQLQRLLDASRDGAVGGGGLGVARRVVVEGDDGGGVQQERPLDDLAGVDLGTIYGAEEEVFDRQDGVPGVEKDAAEDFTVPVGAVGAKEGGGAGRVGDLALTLQLPAQDALGGFQDQLISIGLLQPQVARFHGEFSRGGSASWSRPGVPTARIRTHERARVSARSGGRNGSRGERPWEPHHGQRSAD